MRFNEVTNGVGRDDLLTMPSNTVVINTPGDLDWYKIGQNFPTLDKMDPREFGQGDSDMVISFQSDDEKQAFLKLAKKLGLLTKDIGGTALHPEIHEDGYSSDEVLTYIKTIHKDRWSKGADAMVTSHDTWHLTEVPLSALHIPDPYSDNEINDPYNRILDIDPYHVADISAKDIKNRPIVVDQNGHIIDGNHRALAAKDRKMTTIPAYVPGPGKGKKISEHQLVWAKSKSGPKMKWRCTTGLRQGRVVPNVLDCSQPIDVAKRAQMKLTRANTKIRQARKAKKTKRVNPTSRLIRMLNAVKKHK